MHVIVTGAGGFVGQALVQRLLNDPAALPRPLSRLTAIDQGFGTLAEAWRADARVVLLQGDFGQGDVLAQAMSPSPDCVFHLASVPGSRAEREPALGLQVNLLATVSLLNRVAACVAESAVPPRVVFASSVAVYGALPADGQIDETQPARPALSYGAHKLMSEILLADLSRRRELDGVSLRLPGIVARPPAPTGHGSAFMSDVIRKLFAGEAYECPVSSRARAWWMSLACCVDNLLHAAQVPGADLPPSRTVQLPVLTATVGELVAVIASLTGRPADLRFRPDERIESLFGRLPPLHTPVARRLGFIDDGSLADMVSRCVAAPVAA